MLSRILVIALITIALIGISSSTASAQLVVRAIGGAASEDVYGFGLGGSVGFNLPLGTRGFFVGARGVYHTGQDLSLGGGITSETGLIMYGLEFGGTWLKSPILIRTAGTLGVASSSVKNLTGGSVVSKLTNNKFLFGPGLLIAVPVGPALIGVEPRYLRVFGGTSSFAIYGTLGFDIDLTP